MLEQIKSLLGLGPRVNYKELVENGAIILDVRTKGEFKTGCIQGSLNMPVESLRGSLSRLSKDKTIITCCASGMRSGSAKRILKSNGFKEVHNGGGWMSLQYKIR
ncbi:MAG TPA: sulfurtransferase [Cytophagales bacterium]|nr:sulfurtransferase [Cytophagales bacterium]